MRAITLSRIVAAIAALTLANACNDTTGPGDQPGGGAPDLGVMSIVPRSASLHPGQTVALKATLIDDGGDRMEGLSFSWSSSNDAVATVAASGEVQARSPGFAVITASALGKSQISTIRVHPRFEGDPVKRDKYGRPITQPALRRNNLLRQNNLQ